MFERGDLGVLKKEAKAGAKELARLGEKVARERARQKALEAKRAKEAAALAQKEAEKATKEKARQEAEAVREREKQEAIEAQWAKEAAAMAQKEAEKAAKEKARQEAEAVREREKQEAIEAQRAKESIAMAQKEAEKAAKNKARQEAMEAKRAKEAAALAQKEAEKVTQDKAKRDAELAMEKWRKEAIEEQKAKEAAALAQKEAEKAAKEKARQEAEAVREREKQEAIEAQRAKEAIAMAQKEAEKAAKEKARQEAESIREREKQEAIEAQRAKEAAALAQKEADKAAKEKARQEAEAVREREKQEAIEAKRAQAADALAKIEIKAAPRAKKGQQVAAMVPVFSRRSILIITIGLIVGVGLGIGYWIINTSLGYSSVPAGGQAGGQAQSAGVLQSLLPAPPSDVPWTSKVDIQVVNPGSSVMSVQVLNNWADYYAAKVSSLPFLEFLSQKLAEQAPQYSLTADELAQIIKFNRNLNSGTSAIQVRVTATTAEETVFLASFVPKTFKNFLISEEDKMQEQEYQTTLKAMDVTKAALLEAEQEMNAIAPPTSDIFNNDPKYIALNAKINALELEVNRQATGQATMIANGGVSEDSQTQEQEYQKTLQAAKAVNVALSKAQQELQPLEMQKTASNIQNDPNYITLNAKINALESELNRQMTGYVQMNSIGQQQTVLGLAQMIALGITTGSDYANMQKNVDTTSAALSEARKQFSILESQSSNNGSMANLDYQIAQARVDTLNKELAALKDKLTLLAPENVVEENQIDTQAVYERTSAALADARKELGSLRSQIGGDRLAGDPNYDVAQAKVNNLRTALTNLTSKLNSSIGNSVNLEEITRYLVAGNPSTPSPILPVRMRGRTALMMGAVIGIGGAWVLLNRRWLVKALSPSPQKEEDEV